MKIRHIFPIVCLLMTMATALVVCSCDTPEAEGNLSVSPTSLAFDSAASEMTLTVTSTKAWKATITGDGFALSSSSGEGNAEVKVSASANESLDTRTGKITITSGNLKAEVSLSQKGEDAVVNVDGNSYSVSGEGASFEVDVQYNTDFNVTVDEGAKGWLSYEIADTKAMKDSKIRFSAEYNYCPERKAIVTVSDKTGKLEPFTIEVVQSESRFRQGLMKLYNALDGPNWPSDCSAGWGSDNPYTNWNGVWRNTIRLKDFRLNGELPDCFEDFADYLESFEISEIVAAAYNGWKITDNVKGTLPPSFAKLTKLKILSIEYTSMTGLPDLFQNMPELSKVTIKHNDNMSGPLPVSIGLSTQLKELDISYNAFTGKFPEEWCTTDKSISAGCNSIVGTFPLKFYDMPSVAKSFWGSVNQTDRTDPQMKKYYHMDISNAPFIPGFGDDANYVDINGASCRIPDIITQNDYTIVVYWDISNGKSMMNQIKTLYDTYHSKGLEVVAIETSENHEKEVEEYLKANGMDKWRNVDKSKVSLNSYPSISPAAEVYDRRNHTLFHWDYLFEERPDIFCKIQPALDLAPFILELYGDFDPNYVSTDFSKDGEVMTLQKATRGNGIDIVLLGDAYTDKDMNPGGLYEKVMNEAMEAFFDIEPYKSFRDRFNVYAVKAVSKNCINGETHDTRFDTFNDIDGSVNGSLSKCYEYALKVPDITDKENLTVITLINSHGGAATTYMTPEDESSVAFINAYNNDINLYGAVIKHEAGGHGFCKLADEYGTYAESPVGDYIKNMIELYEKQGWMANIDYTDDPEKIRWAHFLKNDRYKGSVGIFEGGDTYKYGVWRPSKNSMMNTNEPYFNAPSREAIYKRIMKLSGEEYSWENFLKYDEINLGPVSRSGAVKHTFKADSRNNRQHTPPVIIRK